MTFGQQLRAWRVERRMSQRDFAAAVGIDFTYLSKIENDRMPPPSGTTIYKMAELLEQNADMLLQLAQKVPSDIKPIISGTREAPALLRAINGLRDDQIKSLTEMARRMHENEIPGTED